MQSKFPEWSPYAESFGTSHALLPDDSSPVMFMRWKVRRAVQLCIAKGDAFQEQFLVPDHRVRSIAGASFAGFYYVCLCKATGVIQGLYFHSKSEWYQSLSLQHSPERASADFEFR